MEASAERVPGNEKHPEFPGYKKDRGFFSELLFDDSWVGQLTRQEVDGVANIRSVRERFEAAV